MNAKEVLTQEQRRRFKSIPEANDPKAVQYYTFTQEQLDHILHHRRDHNRLGFAVQLALVTYPGWPLLHYETIPHSTLAYIASQIHVSPDVFSDYAKREPTRREHLEEIRRTYGYARFAKQHQHTLADMLYHRAWEDDNPVVLMTAAVGWLREHKLIFPAISTIEGMIWEAMHRAEHHMYAMLGAAVTEEQKSLLDSIMEGMMRKSLSWLRDGAGVCSPEGFLKVAERIRCLSEFGLRVDTESIPAKRLQKVTRMASSYDSHLYKKLRPEKKYGLLALHLQMLRSAYIDEAIRIHDGLITRFIADMRQHRKKEKERTPAEDAALTPAFRALFKKRFFRLRKYAPVLLELLDFQGSDSAARLLEAVRMLRQMHENGQRHLDPTEAMLNFVPRKRRRLLLNDRGGVYGYIYELAVLVELRNQLRSGHVWVDGSVLHKPYTAYLLPDSGRGSTDCPEGNRMNTYLQDRQRLLTESLPLVSHSTGIPHGYVIRSMPLRSRHPGQSGRLNPYLHSRLPAICLLDLLKEVDSWIGLTDQFVHVTTRREPEQEEKDRILSLLVGLGTMTGVKPIAQLPFGTYRQYMNTLQWRVNEEAIAQAQREMIAFQKRLPLAAIWAEAYGTSSDLLRVPVTRSSEGAFQGADTTDRYYLYRCMNEQSMIVSTRITDYAQPGFLLEGTTGQDSSYARHYCHYSGYVDRLFGFSHLLGIPLIPRLDRFQSTRLYQIDKKKMLPFMRTGLINTRVIREASTALRQARDAVRAGGVPPSLLYEKLRSQQDADEALRDIGRIEKSLFFIEFLRSNELHAGIERDSLRWQEMNALSKQLIPQQEWSYNGRSAEEYPLFALANSFIVNAVIVWNTVYLEKSAQELMASGKLDEAMLSQVSPRYGGHLMLQS
ncbi:Tn3 family transposase [Paenibacillus campinasensis]|uniref:Tn3 family transposase n=1 Tax=Paenibacillus campinasensis TaxID=66347 RepID=A0A268EQT5_9BACL|nr:Tn3 family transposase [Paenibacillus campinasensis]PAD75474.1 hypothetical protein CHH67_14790 [Paenibacillus campinasensis]